MGDGACVQNRIPERWRCSAHPDIRLTRDFIVKPGYDRPAVFLFCKFCGYVAELELEGQEHRAPGVHAGVHEEASGEEKSRLAITMALMEKDNAG